MRRLGRWVLGLVLGVVTLVVLAVVALLAGTRSPAVRDLLRRQTIVQLERALHARFDIGTVGGSLLHTLSLEDVRMSVDGKAFVHVARLAVAYDLAPLLRGELRLSHVVIERPRVRMVHQDGAWRLPKGRGERRDQERSPRDDRGPRLTLVVERLEVVDGRVDVALLDGERPRRFAATRIGLDATARVNPRQQTFEVRRLGFVPRGVALQPIEAVLVGAVERDGPVRISRLDVATPQSRLAGTAVVTPRKHVDAAITFRPLAAADVRALVPETKLVADARGRVRARGPWQAIAAVVQAKLQPGGTLAAHSTLDVAARPPRHATRVRFADIDPSAIVRGLPDGSLQGVVWASGSGFDARRPLTYGLALNDSSIAGRALQRVDVKGRGTRDLHRLDAALVAPLGEATLDGRLRLGRAPRYRASTHLTVSRLDLLTPSTWGWLVGDANLRGHGFEADGRRARLVLAVTGASVHGVPITRADVRARLDGSRLAPATLVVDAADLHVDGSGQADVTRRTGDLTIAGRADLGGIGAYLGRPLSGRTTLSFGAHGKLDDVAAEMTAGIEKGAYERVSAERAALHVQLRGLGGAAPGGDARVDVEKLRLGTDAPYAARADAGWRRKGREDRVDATVTATNEDGRLQQVAGNLVHTGERTRAELRDLTVTPPQGPVWHLARPAAMTIGEAVTVDRLVLEGADQRITLAGRVALSGGTSDATLALETIRLGPVCAMTDLPSCAGRLSARLALTGTASAPVAEVTAHGERLRVREVPYGVLDVTARAAELRAMLDATMRHPDAGEVVVRGTAPLDFAWGRPRRDLSDAPVDLTATASNLDLTMIGVTLPRYVDSSSGRMSLDLAIRGPRRGPRVSGQLAIDDGSVELRATGVPYEAIRTRLVADGARVQVQELHAEGGEGTADITGSVDLPLGTAGATDLALRLDQFFAVHQEAYEAAVSGALAVRGPLDAPQVSGNIDVDYALVRPAGLPASGPTVPRDPTIEVVGTVVAPEEEVPSAVETALEGPLGVAVTVTVERNAWIRRDDADIEIAGELKIVKKPWEPVRISGQIRLVRGWYAFQGRRFTLQQGTITFAGGTPPSPTFDITAVYRAGDYEIEVRITGSAEKPTLALSSNPPLEQADILSVLLFGKPAHDLGRGQSAALQDQALQLAAGYVMPELRTSVMNALGVDTLEVELPQGTDQGKVSAGRYVAQDVFLSLSQELGARAGQEVGIEYSLGKNVSARGSTSTRGTSAIDLFWHYRY